MTAFDYSGSVATAKRLIARFGKTVTLIKRTKTGPARSPVYVPVETSLTAVDLNKAVRDKAGTLTGTTERKLLIEGGASAVPAKDDVVTIDGADHVIDVVKTLNPGDTVVLYTVWLVN
ncbi:hypothetical protein JQX09_17620 [Sulfitobacter pseudonitzschiae]|uniref:Uncharacterized protein n=1 Tax=Pseudosulfitobacter pseudonitzschiae TaxID=1402135 RepID=A0A9Q2S1M9_9RHOB|nr:hypothetical protein [Pseudosulfitobacter pseudonitzschiae]MBM2293751.1 hypothetical protein [Pseudosulfitobacter pseudonitzschiae]MBM2298669.1 hypothetical protein [Pseudosulfitobacter pseudonitzschiae]MBM2303583.1 hypothetical protein [Pseudosulfitobacter pseudonitzschiae]MBM2313366.1 hypothetical protein [Pseudosulfitobacter pseudonitzschiae]MBM2318279.1 hypothetical protein [Pseudosulfitobacter pseudonitzschiae]